MVDWNLVFFVVIVHKNLFSFHSSILVIQNKTLLSNLGTIYNFIHIWACVCTLGTTLANLDIVVSLTSCNCHSKKKLRWLVVVHVTLTGLFLAGADFPWPLACGIYIASSWLMHLMFGRISHRLPSNHFHFHTQCTCGCAQVCQYREPYTLSWRLYTCGCAQVY